MHSASFYGKPEIVQLLDHGAEANAEGDNGENPLHKVSCGEYEPQEGRVRVAQLLLERGVDINARCKDHCTPLFLASYCGKLEIVRLLLDHGAEVSAETNNGDNPLHAVTYGRQKSQEDGVRVARLLLERGVNVNARRNDHCTPLLLASYHGKLEIVRLLLDHGAEADVEADNGENPLHKVLCGKHDPREDGVRVARLLLERGVDVNVQRNDNRTPLHIASYYGNLETARLLLDYGAKVDAVDDWGGTPLHDVSQGPYDSEEAGVGVARQLLDHGADVNAKARFGRTPLALLSCRKRPKLAELLEHAATVNRRRSRASSSRADYFKW